MNSAEQRQALRKAFGHPLTTKKQVRDAMGYKNYTEIREYFYGLSRFKSKYFTDEVIERIFQGRTYEES